MAEEKTKINWEEIVAKSEGERIFLPAGFEKQAKEIEEKRAEYDKEVVVMAKKQLTINTAVNELFFELRKHLEKNGYPDIWIKDVGYEEAALKEGKLVVNITNPQRRG